MYTDADDSEFHTAIGFDFAHLHIYYIRVATEAIKLASKFELDKNMNLRTHEKENTCFHMRSIWRP
jgi:hypothetical protein